jgi:hypothetical protein
MKLETAKFIICTYFLTLEEYLHEIETSLSPQFSCDIFTIMYLQTELFYLCRFIIITNFSVAQKMLCTPFNILEIVLVRQQFFSRYVKA